jgi:hypothetical protein
MAKIFSNKKKPTVKASKSVKSESSDSSTKKTKPRYEVEQITNGYIVTKSWTDENYNYKSERTYYEENPIDL